MIRFLFFSVFLSIFFSVNLQAAGTLWKCSYSSNKHENWNVDAKANVFAQDEWYFIPKENYTSNSNQLTSVPGTSRRNIKESSKRFEATEEFYQKLPNAGGSLNGFRFTIIFSNKIIIQTLKSSQASMNASDATTISQDPTRRGKCEKERLSSFDEIPPQNYMGVGYAAPKDAGKMQNYKDAIEICLKLGFIEKTEKFSSCVSSLVD